jgi:hypothetical protein
MRSMPSPLSGSVGASSIRFLEGLRRFSLPAASEPKPN